MYSSLPSVAELSGGKYTHVTHAESKATVSEYAKSQLGNVTLLYPGEPSSCLPACEGRAR